MNTFPGANRQSPLDHNGIGSCLQSDSTAHHSRRRWTEEPPENSAVSLESSGDLSFDTAPSIPLTFYSDYYEESISLLSITLSIDDSLPKSYLGSGDNRPLAFRGRPSLATVVAQLKSTPPMPDSLTSVLQEIEGSRVGRKHWRQLQALCITVARMTGARTWYDKGENYPRLQRASKAFTSSTIAHIGERAKYWSQASDLVALVQFRKMREEISGHIYSIHFCYERLATAIHLVHQGWIEQLEAIQRERMRTLTDRMHLKLEAAADTLDTRAKATKETFELLSRIIDDNMVEILQNQTKAFVATYADAQRMVDAVKTVIDIQLLIQLLIGQQWTFDDIVLVKTGVTCDTYSAALSTNDKVAKKVLRITVSEREHIEWYAHSFLQNAKLWATFKSEYTMQLYGIGIDVLEDDRHFQLYAISPWMKNSDAATYLMWHKEDPGMKEGIMRIITDAAQGLQYLHSREPPAVHGSMRGDNILITNSGGGILSGFGLTEVLQNSTGDDKIPSAVMASRIEPRRWMAPEMHAEDSPDLQTPSDVWDWAMTALELISGLPPYYQREQPHTVMLDIRLNKRPLRAKHADFEKYALKPDEMWALLEKCWAIEPDDWPTIGEVIIELKEMTRK